MWEKKKRLFTHPVFFMTSISLTDHISSNSRQLIYVPGRIFLSKSMAIFFLQLPHTSVFADPECGREQDICTPETLQMLDFTNISIFREATRKSQLIAVPCRDTRGYCRTGVRRCSLCPANKRRKKLGSLLSCSGTGNSDEIFLKSWNVLAGKGP